MRERARGTERERASVFFSISNGTNATFVEQISLFFPLREREETTRRKRGYNLSNPLLESLLSHPDENENENDDDDDDDNDDGDDDDNEDDDDDDENENDGNSDSELDDSLAHFHHDLFAFAPSDDKAVKNKRAKVTPSRGLKEQSDWRNEKSANSAIDVEQQARKASDAENRAPQKKGIAETSSSPMRPFEVPRYHPLVSLFYTVASNKSCVSCGSSRAVIRNNPCGHVTCCMACAEKPKRCLQCHLPIQKLSLMPPCP